MLLGTYPVKLAGNHRTAVPSPLRRELGDSIIIAKWYEGCLVVIAKGQFSALLTRITGKSTLITDPVRGSEHFIFSSSYEVEIDDQGRMVIPETLITYASLSEDIYFLGVGDRVEIWDKVIWDEKEKQVVKDAPKYIEELAKNEK
jgi:MraZ protein